jgi:hypothetical protein
MVSGKDDVVNFIVLFFLCWIVVGSYHDILGLWGSWDDD